LSQSTQRFGVPVMVQLDQQKTICRFGRRIESVTVSNNTAAARLIELAHYNSSFYLPMGISGNHGNRREIHSPTCFYLRVPAGDTRSTGPFFARRGLVLKPQGSGGNNVFATVVVHGIDEGDYEEGRS
jgi:hypothetical protein